MIMIEEMVVKEMVKKELRFMAELSFSYGHFLED